MRFGRTVLAGVIVVAGSLAITMTAHAAGWSAQATGDAAARGAVLPAVKRPEIVVGVDGSINVRWMLTRFGSGDDVPGYVVERVDGSGAATVACTVDAPMTDCIDPVPAETPVRYQVRSRAELWRGPPSPLSSPTPTPSVLPALAPLAPLVASPPLVTTVPSTTVPPQGPAETTTTSTTVATSTTLGDH